MELVVIVAAVAVAAVMIVAFVGVLSARSRSLKEEEDSFFDGGGGDYSSSYSETSAFGKNSLNYWAIGANPSFSPRIEEHFGWDDGGRFSPSSSSYPSSTPSSRDNGQSKEGYGTQQCFTPAPSGGPPVPCDFDNVFTDPAPNMCAGITDLGPNGGFSMSFVGLNTTGPLMGPVLDISPVGDTLVGSSSPKYVDVMIKNLNQKNKLQAPQNYTLRFWRSAVDGAGIAAVALMGVRPGGATCDSPTYSFGSYSTGVESSQTFDVPFQDSTPNTIYAPDPFGFSPIDPVTFSKGSFYKTQDMSSPSCANNWISKTIGQSNRKTLGIRLYVSSDKTSVVGFQLLLPPMPFTYATPSSSTSPAAPTLLDTPTQICISNNFTHGYIRNPNLQQTQLQYSAYTSELAPNVLNAVYDQGTTLTGHVHAVANALRQAIFATQSAFQFEPSRYLIWYNWFYESSTCSRNNISLTDALAAVVQYGVCCDADCPWIAPPSCPGPSLTPSSSTPLSNPSPSGQSTYPTPTGPSSSTGPYSSTPNYTTPTMKPTPNAQTRASLLANNVVVKQIPLGAQLPSGQNLITNLKAAILQYGVVMVSFNLPCGWDSGGGGGLYDLPPTDYICPNSYSVTLSSSPSPSSSPFSSPSTSQQQATYQILSAHAVVLFGWSEGSSGSEFHCVNSYGTCWGTNGTGWMTYAFAEMFLQEAFVIESLTYPSDICSYVSGGFPSGFGGCPSMGPCTGTCGSTGIQLAQSPSGPSSSTPSYCPTSSQCYVACGPSPSPSPSPQSS